MILFTSMDSIPKETQEHLDKFFGNEVKRIRYDRERTQASFSEGMHCSERHLVEIEAGRSTPSATILLCLLAALKPEQRFDLIDRLIDETRAQLHIKIMRREGSLLGDTIPV